MSGPAAGWYPDPGGSGGYRYWDGSAWTQALQPHPPATGPHDPGQPSAPAARRPDAAQPSTALPAASPPGPGGTRRRATSWVVAGVTLLVIAVAAIAVFTTLFQRGAATPIAAAEHLVDALNTHDTLGVLRVLAPDEIDAFRGLVEYIPDDPDGNGLLEGIRLEVVFGQATQLTEGVASIPIERFTLQVEQAGAVADALDLRVGEQIVEELRDEPFAAIVAVERHGSWFISPVGSVLELASRESGLGGAAPAVPRSGAGSPQGVVEDAVRSLGEEDLGRLVDLLDPEEFQILNHYRPLLSQDRRAWAGSVRVESEVRGEIVEVRRIEIDDEGYPVTLDLTTMCFEETGHRDCLRNELDVRSGNAAPWELPVIRALLEPQPLPLRIGTVTRSGRSYLSLESTISSSVEPMLDRMGPHNVAGLARPDLSPNAVVVAGVPGEIVDVPMYDNWNAVRFAEGADLRACPPDARSGSDWQVEGARVQTERIGDPFGWQEGDVPGVVLGVQSGHTVDVVQVLLASGDERC